MSGYRNSFNEPKHVSFLIKDDELVEKYNEIWDKISNGMKNGFDSEPVHNEKYLQTKIKSYGGKISINFLDDGMPKESAPCISLSVTLIDSVFKIGKNYSPQVFLEEC